MSEESFRSERSKKAFANLRKVWIIVFGMNMDLCDLWLKDGGLHERANVTRSIIRLAEGSVDPLCKGALMLCDLARKLAGLPEVTRQS